MNSISHDIVDNTANVLLENVKAGFNYDIYCVTVSSSGARMNYNTMINNKITISTTGTRKIYVELLKNGVISSQNKKNVLQLNFLFTWDPFLQPRLPMEPLRLCCG